MARSSRKRGPGVLIAVVVIAVAGLAFAAFLRQRTMPRPIEYASVIEEYSSEYELDPYMVAAVINTESGFNPDAVSRVGAIGLMQIMPDTGDWIAGKLGLDSYSSDALYDPGTNIRFGCWYLHFLHERFHGDATLVAAAYNAGHGRVDDWLNDEAVADAEGNLVRIPYEETSDYVEKIRNTTNEYRKTYPGVFARN